MQRRAAGRLNAIRAGATFVTWRAAIADLVGSVERLPPHLSARYKHYLKTTGYGRRVVDAGLVHSNPER
jgi:hypothetical protein